LQKLESWEFTRQSKYFTPGKFDDFNGHSFKIAYIDYFPYIYCTKKNTTKGVVLCEDAIGLEYDLLTTLSYILNFTYDLIESPNRSYDTLFNGLILEDYDFAVGGLSVSSWRQKLFPFSSVIMFEQLACIFNNQRPFSLSSGYLNVLKTDVQIAIITVTGFVALVTFLIIRFCNGNSSLPYIKILKVSLTTSQISI
jgi:hypothetical protein